MDETSLRELIRGKVERGELPADRPQRIWTGYGRGEPCAACGEAIDAGEVEYELDFSASGTWGTLRLHGSCAELWNRQRRAGA